MVVVVVSVVLCWCCHTDGCSSGECCVGVGTPMDVVVVSVVLVLAHRWL